MHSLSRFFFGKLMNGFGLINMFRPMGEHEQKLRVTFGRVYDPKLGRFLSPDPILQDAGNTQNLNRYSYVLNNPLKYTDPSGYTYRAQAVTFKGRENPDGSYGNWGSFDGGGGSVFPRMGTLGSPMSSLEYDMAIANIWDEMSGTTVHKDALRHSIANGYYNRGKARELDRKFVYTNSKFTGVNIYYGYAIDLGYSATSQGGGSNWATATLAFIAADIAIPEPTDAAWPKWAGYAVAGAAAAAYIAYNNSNNNFFYVTYTKTNAQGMVYVGRSSGYGDPYSVVKARDANHHMTGYGPAVLSTSARATVPGGYSTRAADPSYWYTRGAEQVQIQYYRSQGISGNSINGIGPNNPNIWKYLDEFTKYKF